MAGISYSTSPDISLARLVGESHVRRLLGRYFEEGLATNNRRPLL
jgi:hypothetical protein